MLPFGLKLAWFALSLSGLIGCWAVLLPLAWAIKSYWGPIAYAVGITALEGVFCIGLIWKMDPVNLPLAFCLVQVLVMGLAVFMIIGALAAITTASAIYIAKPKQWGLQDENPILPWRYHYLLPMMLFPILASTVHVILVVFYDTFNVADGLTCAEYPLWMAFAGYAGTPFLITIPCLWLSAVSALRVRRTHKHIKRARRSVNFDALDHFTVRPVRRKSRQSLQTQTTPPPTPRAITAPSPGSSTMLQKAREEHRQAVNPVLRQEKAMNFHLPFSPPFPEYTYTTPRPGHRSQMSDDSFDTVSSVSFLAIDVKERPARTFEYSAAEDDEVRTPLRSLRSYVTPTGTQRSTQSGSVHNSDRISITQLAFGLGNADLSESTEHPWATRSAAEFTLPSQLSYKSPAELPSTVRSFLIFQFAIIAIHLLSSITPLIDAISSHAEPTALGTQHVALLLAAWAPVLIFGPLSAVRRQFVFWR
ncbi:hypothetical protein B0H15DRAFT_114822 [Mycena belliarum]|uniref:Uncharacterized protein n=1 Tax=Mycena belliarum TaxID=1033014 RepID=A0AAD6TPI9_9AGAR|nr:hypothetical protein B0H15DRAFT_114822 [Mycena belliae]